MSNIQSHYIMDYETLKGMFCGVFVHYKTDEAHVFIISEYQNDLVPFLAFLDQNILLKQRHISFNGLSFDSQITQAILKNRKKLLKMTAAQTISFIYDTAQDTIRKSNSREWSSYPEYKLSIGQIDVFKILHWDNANKRTSLKWAEFAMDWENVQDMPIPHTREKFTQEEVDLVANYCWNDVKATKKIYEYAKPLLEVRLNIIKNYGLNCMNYSNTKLGSELLLQLYCDQTGRDHRELRKTGTKRDGIPIKDIIFGYVNFKTLDLQNFLAKVNTQVIFNTKSDFKHVLKYKGSEFHIAAGGIHQCIKAGVYEADDYFDIIDCDVASLYPSIACVNQMYPAHLGKEFYQVYKNDIVDVRLAEKAKPKADRNISIIEGFKEAANATYGNSNSEYSWLYDPQYTMQTTINGQLMLLMLVEDLLTIPEIILLQTNTDGITVKIPKKYQSLYYDKCKAWENITSLTLEYAEYKSMMIRDVNNYISLYTDGKTKCKGAYEWEDLEKHKYTHLHKNKSHLIVTKAVYNYFINNIPPEQYLQDNRNIFDYCAGVKSVGGWKVVEHVIKDGIPQKNPQQKIVRYYISKRGAKLVKTHEDGREIQVEAGPYYQTVFNVYQKKPWSKYDVEDKYYLDAIYKEISNILAKPKKQLDLFS